MFSPPGRDGSNEPQAGTQGQEAAGKRTKRGELPPSFDTPGANQRINWQASRANAAKYPHLDQQYQTLISSLVEEYTSHGIVAILDLHWDNDDTNQQPMAGADCVGTKF